MPESIQNIMVAYLAIRLFHVIINNALERVRVKNFHL